jgi:Terminase small subunit
MPALDNPRWERFCQLIVFGDIASNKQAYIEAGYKARDNGAEVNACKLLRLTKPVINRIRELQDQQRQALEERNRFTRDTLAERMALASRIAEEDRNPSALYGAEQAIAKLYGLDTEQTKELTVKDAKSMQDIGLRLLQSIGLQSPSPLDIAAAIEANDRFVNELEAIKDRAQSTIDAT